jgi:electron transport complex protein RnfD
VLETAQPSRGNDSSVTIMWLVCAALFPGIMVQATVLGWGTLSNVVVCVSSAIVFEAAVLWPSRPSRRLEALDGSAALTGLLVAIALPGACAWWVGSAAVAFGLLIAKHAYGGMGQNPFNPAMAGIAFALVSFPAQMAMWSWVAFEPSSALGGFLGGLAASDLYLPDAYTGATDLDAYRAARVVADTLGTAEPSAASALLAGAYGLGGCALLWRGVIHWRLPAVMLATVAVCSLAAHVLEPSRFASPLFHLASGAVVVAAFFVVTDPITAPMSVSGQVFVGAVVGVVVFVIRSWGAYPDGVAFAILIGNMLTPTVDRWLLRPPRAP